MANPDPVRFSQARFDSNVFPPARHCPRRALLEPLVVWASVRSVQRSWLPIQSFGAGFVCGVVVYQLAVVGTTLADESQASP
ncbi:hypothetical protein VB773_16225 [Haloarculaceae archaeon H-GB2-1]|nr:hypothetical protein [Haloarculaceae archaeon H-GB1-1]MEA5387481.1 hypothetical protein [Haloarculaceae archaeon H-GB11]MEA5408962.1 hypothetical protein [Haloarculaceae archaeon H-GB2-1]